MAKLIPDSINSFRAEEHTKGWPGSGFVAQVTELKARRVTVDGADQAQIGFEIAEIKGAGNRLYKHYGSLVLNAEQIDALISALQNVKTYEKKA